MSIRRARTAPSIPWVILRGSVGGWRGVPGPFAGAFRFPRARAGPPAPLREPVQGALYEAITNLYAVSCFFIFLSEYRQVIVRTDTPLGSRRAPFRYTVGFLIHDFGVRAAPAVGKTIQKGGVFRTPPFGRVFPAAGAAQTSKSAISSLARKP